MIFDQRNSRDTFCNVTSLSPQGEEAEGDAGDGAAARQEHEQPANVAVSHRGGAGQAGGLQRLPQR